MLKQIPVAELRLGMHIEQLCGSWLEHPFWRTRFVLTNPDDLTAIRRSGIAEVVIDLSKSTAPPAGARTPAVTPAVQPPAAAAATPPEMRAAAPAVPAEVEIQRAKRICAQARDKVIDMFGEARLGRAVHAENALPLVAEISSSVARNPGALISLARLKSADEYTFLHSVAVCALMIALARQLGLDEDATREAGLAGLMHDLGKAAVPLAILNKPGRLTDEEFAVVRRHPQAGYDLLLEANGAREALLDVVLHHHEKLDGSGYPKGLSGDAISRYAKMSAVCDVYDAVTSNRPYKSGWEPAESLRRMAEWQGHFDPLVFQAFVRSVGIYPIGSLVRMESNRLGVVIEQHPTSLVTPLVKLFFSAKSRAQIPVEIVDLGKPGCHDRIVGREDPRHWGIEQLHRLWAGG